LISFVVSLSNHTANQLVQSFPNISAINLSFDESMMWVDLSDGRKLGVPLAYFPRLLRATSEQRM
jgi:hypothetical protein